MELRPTRITASRSRRLLTVDWSDGHHSEFPFSLLRESCPCAQCRGEPGSPRLIRIPLGTPGATDLEQVTSVGNYAIQLTWKDGHSFGIYTWEYLLDLCPCPEHAGKPRAARS
jgi:DUF971 family protein